MDIKMKVNGYKIQQDIREAQEERNLLTERFTPALTHFPEDKVTDVSNLVSQISDLETRITELQVAQANFNLNVRVALDGNQISLMSAVKRKGGLERVVNLWREASKETEIGHYRSFSRDRDVVLAKRTISVEQADEFRREARKRLTTLQAAIQQGNSESVDVKSIDYPV